MMIVEVASFKVFEFDIEGMLVGGMLDGYVFVFDCVINDLGVEVEVVIEFVESEVYFDEFDMNEVSDLEEEMDLIDVEFEEFEDLKSGVDFDFMIFVF